ncbi:MAG: NAD(+)/NADH kinase [Spirochaetales bacterium]|jgi:hypothetical protein|nr:NAD(+)/NADH kinase [Spirochaetales bacterium]
MSSIGIIANPASGKDIRRLVSYATVIDNNEKVNIVKRIILAAQAFGVEKAYFMPDTFCIGYTVQEDLSREGVLTAGIEVLDMQLSASAADSTAATVMMESLGAGCILALGGDGTNRAVAAGIKKTPLIAVSTGTNNVYPAMLEGTVAGMAAAAVAGMEDPYAPCIHDKRIELAINGKDTDSALIDAALTEDLYAGTKAVWDISRIRCLVVSRCHPASIGFSAIAGCIDIVRDTDDWGLCLNFPEGESLPAGGKKILAPVAAGILTELTVSDCRRLNLEEEFVIKAGKPGMIALDGEREVQVREGDTLSFRLRRSGPWRVDVRKALEMAQKNGMYNR